MNACNLCQRTVCTYFKTSRHLTNERKNNMYRNLGVIKCFEKYASFSKEASTTAIFHWP